MILGYTRVSTDEQASGDRTSLAEQERVIRAFAVMKGARNFDTMLFSDPGVSGSIPLAERPKGGELLAVARKGDTVVASKLDRLFRSARDALNVAEDLKDKGIGVVLLDIGSDSVTGNGAAQLFFTVLAAVATFERGRIVERITTGRRAKVANGGHGGGRAPYGFRVIGRGKAARLAPVAGEQKMLAAIDELKAAHTPYGLLCELRRRGFVNRKGGQLHLTQLQRILARLILARL